MLRRSVVLKRKDIRRFSSVLARLIPSALQVANWGISRPMKSPRFILREFRIKNPEINIGEKVTVEAFAIGERVDVIGTSKGKGFAGGVKRYGFRGGPKTHGQSDRQRAPGSRGAGTTPGRVYKGSRGPGHMGNTRVTVSALQVVLVDAERNLLGIRGAVPGPKGGLIMIKEARKQ